MTAHWADWQAYPWKNELSLQAGHVRSHVLEILDEDYEGEHNPHHMLERALCLSAFCVRRMVEKRLVTDQFAATAIEVRTFHARSGADPERPAFHRSAGGTFSNFDFGAPAIVRLKPKSLADEIIHSSQLMVVGDEPGLADGLLVVSDWHLKSRILHMSLGEFQAFADSVLANNVRATRDEWHPETGKVTSTRD